MKDRSKLTALIIAVMLLMLTLLGCANSSDNTAVSPQSISITSKNEESGVDISYDVGYEGVSEENDYGGHKVIRNVYIDLETDNFDEHLNVITEKTTEVGGYIESSQISGRKPEAYNDSGRTATMTLRIPADMVDEFLSTAKTLGTLLSISENSEDVTTEYFDLETRLSVLRTQLERLQSILVETDNLADIIQLETEIARVTTEIEQYTTDIKRYDDLIAFVTVGIDLSEKRLTSGPAATLTTGERISVGFTESINGVAVFFVDLFVWIVSNLPVLAVLAIVAVGVCFTIKSIKKRKQKKKCETTENTINNSEGDTMK